MPSRLRQPTEQEARDLAMTLAGEIDLSRSPLDSPETRTEAANILATIINRFSTDDPRRFGESPIQNYSDYSDVVRNAGQYNAWMRSHVGTTRRNYEINKDYWDQAVADFFSGRIEPSAPNATHYHATQVRPDWSREYDRVAQAGPHIFYNDEAHMGRLIGQVRPSYPMVFDDRPPPPNPVPRPDIAPIPQPDTVGPETAPRKVPPNPVPRPADVSSTRPRGQSQDPKARSVVPSGDRAPAHSAPRPSSRAATTEQHRLRALETVTRRVRPTTHNPTRRGSTQRRLRPGT